MEIEEMKQRLQKELSISRYEHSIGVMKKAGELAKIYGIDEQEAKIVGLMHDIARNKTMEEYILYAQEHNIKLSEEDEQIEVNLHGIIGASILKEEYGFTKEMQEAVYYHTTGRQKMTLLDKIIYVADKIEEGRKYEGVEELRELAKTDINKAILKSINSTIQKCIRNNEKIHSLSIITRNEYIGKNE